MKETATKSRFTDEHHPRVILRFYAFACAFSIVACGANAVIHKSLPISSTTGGSGGSSKTFTFGTSSASWQYEGFVKAHGRGDSIWDDFCTQPSPTGSMRCRNGDATVAVGQYNLTLLQGDIARMRELGTRAYRMSIAWSRIMPTGRPPVEQRGIAHYQQVFQMLRAGGVDPYVTLFHFDLPSGLEATGGWLNISTVEAFAEYAEVCFQEFGSWVNHWITVNEPHTIATAGYGTYPAAAAPGRCSDRSLCAAGDSATEPYITAHNLILSHGRAAAIYHRSYAQSQGGSVTMALSGDWTEPLTIKQEDINAAQRRQEFQIGWFADPIYFGTYPESMRRLVGKRLPVFTADEVQMLQSSQDYFALNHYTSRYAYSPMNGCGNGTGWIEDQCCTETIIGSDGQPIGPTGGSDWLLSVPWGIRKLLRWIHDRYSAEIMITENGADDPMLNGSDPLNDTFRINYHKGYLDNVRLAMLDDGVNVSGYFIWSLLDNFEWADGYSSRFGLWYVDTTSSNATAPSLIRKPKSSVEWFKDAIRRW